ncbi:MAG: D-aminoacyl-tRNA deacylase [Hadesarchaea archaeon]|nr:D-aminoacyl-tRNA deacylase [Hadesarchaea archaeon]
MELCDFSELEENPGFFKRDNLIVTSISGGVTSLEDLPVSADELIVASRHESETGRPCLTTHVPGDLDSGELAISAPFTLKSVLRKLREENRELELGYDVSLEATHHGPVGLSVPVTFVEIGSSLDEWENSTAGEAAARAILAATENQCSGRVGVGVGGTHYARKHSKIVLRTNVGIGHIVPKYQDFTKSLLESTLERTSGDLPAFVLDWKGLNSNQREKIKGIAGDLGVEALRGRDLLRKKKT